MTTKNDEPKFLLTPDDPAYRKPRAPRIDSQDIYRLKKIKLPKRQGIIQTYLSCLVEVISA